MPNSHQSRILLLNGTSSAGKTTLARALRPHLDPTFFYYASDQLADAGFRPVEPATRFATRELFFRGFHRSIAAFAECGLNLLVEHIVEELSWEEELRALLAPFDTYWVGVHCNEEELRRRESTRADRKRGEAEFHLRTHTFCRYDFEVDASATTEENVAAIARAWRARLI